jgi:hypothetical protein
MHAVFMCAPEAVRHIGNARCKLWYVSPDMSGQKEGRMPYLKHMDRPLLPAHGSCVRVVHHCLELMPPCMGAHRMHQVA